MRATGRRQGRPPDLNTATVNWTLSPNGKEFLFIDVGQLGAPRIVLVKSWLELVRSKSAPR